MTMGNMDEDMHLWEEPTEDETQKEGCECECCDTLEEQILEGMSSSFGKCDSDVGYVSIAEYLGGAVNIDVPMEALVSILIDRGVDANTPVTEVEEDVRRLCKADLFVWCCMGMSRKGTVSDSDNGWSHSDGGYTFSDDARRLLLAEANDIYAELGEETVGKTKIRVRSHGVMRSGVTYCGVNRKRVML